MPRLFPTTQCFDFGPNTLHLFARAAKIVQISGSRPSLLRTKVKQHGPNKPGVYGMLDRNGDLIYVGKAKNLRNRLLCYFRPRSRDRKAGRIIRHTSALLWEYSPNEFAALHRELELIRRWRPRFNVQGQPNGRRPIYICLGRQPAPYVFLARRPPRNVVTSYGPIPNSFHASAAVRRLNDNFQLRDCAQSQTMYFADQGDLFPQQRSPGCLRLEIGTCLGPCAGACTRSQYFDQVRQVQDFLEGKNQSLLKQLLRDIEAAAAQQLFERATILRDKLSLLTWLHDQLDQMRQLRRQGSFIYPLQGYDDQTIWYLIHMGRTVAAVAEPHDDDSRREVAALTESVFSDEHRGPREQMLAQRDSILLVASWFRRYPEERGRIIQT